MAHIDGTGQSLTASALQTEKSHQDKARAKIPKGIKNDRPTT